MKTRVPSTITLSAALALALRHYPARRPRRGRRGGKGNFSTAFASRYVWRGQTLSKGIVAQPTVGITLGGFSANLWSNVDLDNDEADDDGIVMNETDLTLNYTVPVGPVSLTGGFIHYDFDGSDTQEIYLTGALAVAAQPVALAVLRHRRGRGRLRGARGLPGDPGRSDLADRRRLRRLQPRRQGDGAERRRRGFHRPVLRRGLPRDEHPDLRPRVDRPADRLQHRARQRRRGRHHGDQRYDGKKDIFYGSIAITAAF